ncbi:hypothetical protein ES815_20180 [Leclercia adecarboxylata]|uniref:Uncharacterized protein n=1 Tax=Leclercia adecarboxylata TaxID=83655 RepID=A0AAP9DCY6_9ENTR|nr:hypothetical protein [Leclercia adecarboxylata]QDK20495.1 hypothetical protein ES815_20180 [Leclercia adecarboxylata]
MGFLKQWLKEEVILIIWGWGCFLSVLFFSMFAVVYFPDVAITMIGAFILLLVIGHLFLWFKYK